MSTRKSPKVTIVSAPEFYPVGFEEYFVDTGVPGDWRPQGGSSDGERLIEYAGRMCYRSFDVAANANLTRVREGNKEYIANILKSRHGSVLEHVNVSFLFHDVSRVFTHELVRHRAGCAYSQESLRFVRLTEIGHYVPSELESLRVGEDAKPLGDYIGEKMEAMEDWQAELYASIDDDEGLTFNEKKKLSSTFRRIGPMGVCTNILMTANLRAVRHLISLRTSAGAEAEIRDAFSQVAIEMQCLYPNVFQDMSENDAGEWVFEFDKI